MSISLSLFLKENLEKKDKIGLREKQYQDLLNKRLMLAITF